MNNDLYANFLQYQAQTTPYPLGISISRAKGSYIYDTTGKSYLDFIAGVSANTLGHGHRNVKKAIVNQTEKYMHVMVYGEFALAPAVELSKKLTGLLPGPNQWSVYLTNSGTEATEGALKLAKRVTGRHQIIAAEQAYHGNTQGAMSVCGNPGQIRAFRPLVPGVSFIRFNDFSDIERIDNKTAAVILETIQGGAGFIVPKAGYLKKVKEKCESVGALLILDEIQTGIGRTGTFFGFERFDICPDIIIAGKGLGGGMPIGAFIAKKEYMDLLRQDPALGHITTFGGNPVIAAAALATVDALEKEQLMAAVPAKEKLFRKLLQHPEIVEVRGIGLMLAVMVKTPGLATKIILKAKERGLLLFWLLHEQKAIRISPPLNISEAEIEKGCEVLLGCLDEIA